MKNLLIYINPRKDFGEEERTTVKIQIDNSLDLGWKKDDILLVTNFGCEYRGVRSLVVSGENFCPFCPPASKINVFLDLIEKKIIEDDQTYWFHDNDAFQLADISERELELDKSDILLPDYGRLPRWATGSVFFKASARDIFSWVKKIMYKYSVDEERAFWILTGHDSLDSTKSYWIKGYTSDDIPQIQKIVSRIKKANITYNFHCFNFRSNFKAAIKPIKVAHFHFLERPLNPLNPRPNQIDFFLRGKNELGFQIVPDRLVKIFNNYGIGSSIFNDEYINLHSPSKCLD